MHNSTTLWPPSPAASPAPSPGPAPAPSPAITPLPIALNPEAEAFAYIVFALFGSFLLCCCIKVLVKDCMKCSPEEADDKDSGNRYKAPQIVWQAPNTT